MTDFFQGFTTGAVLVAIVLGIVVLIQRDAVQQLSAKVEGAWSIASGLSMKLDLLTRKRDSHGRFTK